MTNFPIEPESGSVMGHASVRSGLNARYRLALTFAGIGFAVLGIRALVGWPTYGEGITRVRFVTFLEFLGWALVATGAFIGVTAA